MTKCLAIPCLFAVIVIAQGSETSRPFVLNLHTTIIDSDADRLPDEWENAFGYDPLDPADAGVDEDNDGKTTLDEYNAGTDPRAWDTRNLFGLSPWFILDLTDRAPDTDHDGLPDWWELQYAGSITGLDPFADPDGDGMINLEEYNGGWNPLVAELDARSRFASQAGSLDTGAYPLGFIADSDGDGMPDWWEVKYTLNPLIDDSGADPDGDGIANVVEYRLGMQPNRDDIIGVAWAESLPFLLDTVGLRVDTDGDGLPDWWEIAFGLDPATPDAELDPDGDGRTNIEEYNAGTHPLVDDWAGPDVTPSQAFLLDTGAFPAGFSADADGDGMPDWWEVRYGLNPGDPSDVGADPDGDGFSNLQEYLAGTNPLALDFVLVADAEGNIFVLDTGAKFLDTDGDGIPDWWERDYSGRATGISALGVYDASGLTALEKYTAGFSLGDTSSVFEIKQVEAPDPASPGSLVIIWDTKPDRRYTVYTQTNLNERWSTTPVYQVDGDGMPKRYTNAPGQGVQFMRIAVEVPDAP